MVVSRAASEDIRMHSVFLDFPLVDTSTSEILLITNFGAVLIETCISMMMMMMMLMMIIIIIPIKDVEKGTKLPINGNVLMNSMIGLSGSIKYVESFINGITNPEIMYTNIRGVT